MEPKKHEYEGASHHACEVKSPYGPLTGDSELPAADDKTIFDSLQRRILSSIVTECLDSHESCTGYYTDTSEQYVLRCCCSCHGKIAQAIATGNGHEKNGIDKEKGMAICTKEGSDVVETNQLHPRPLLTFFRSSRTNLYQYQLCHLNEEHPTYSYLIQRGGVIPYAYHTYY